MKVPLDFLVFIKVLWQHGKENQGEYQKLRTNDGLRIITDAKIRNAMFGDSRCSLVHAIVLSLNWLLLYEHFSAGGVPL